MLDLLSACLNQCRDKQRMIKVMMDANHISERLVSMRQEISDLKVMNAQYWVKRAHTALEKSAHALREERLLGIKQELSIMMKHRD